MMTTISPMSRAARVPCSQGCAVAMPRNLPGRRIARSNTKAAKIQ